MQRPDIEELLAKCEAVAPLVEHPRVLAILDRVQLERPLAEHLAGRFRQAVRGLAGQGSSAITRTLKSASAGAKTLLDSPQPSRKPSTSSLPLRMATGSAT